MPEDPKPKVYTSKDLNPSTNALQRQGVVFGGKSQSKYDVGSLVSDLPDLNAVRAEQQGFFDALGNTAVNLVTTLVGQTVETIGALVDPVYNWIAQEDLKTTEGITGLGAGIQEYGQENNPIYYDPKKGFNADYILSHLPSVVSTAAMLIPGYGIGRGAGLAARALRMGKLGEQALSIGLGSAAMRHSENWMESAQIYNQIMREGVEGLDPRFDKLGYGAIEDGAKAGAAYTYAANWGNIVFDMMQMAALIKPIKGLTGWTNTVGKESKMAQVMDYGYKAAVEKGLLKDASRLNKAGLWGANAVRPFLQQTTEGLEEAWNDISSKEGHRQGLIASGAIEDDGSNFFDRMGGYMKDASLWDSFAWGIIGGVTFQAGGEMLNRAGAKAGWWNDTTEKGQMLADLKQRSSIVSKGYKDLANPNFTEYDKALVKGNMLFNLVKSNKSAESLDMLQEDLTNPKMVQHFSQLMGLKEEDARKEMATIKDDIEFINDKLDYYTGATTGTWFGKPAVTTTGVGLEEDKTIVTPGVKPFTFTRSGKKVPFVYDARAAQMLAYNDYSVLVKDRLNKQAAAEMLGLQQRAFEGTELDANSQSVFSTISDMAALTNLLKHEKADLADRQNRKVSDVFIKASQHRVTKAEELLEKRKKQLDGLKEAMNANVESGVSANTFGDASKHAILVMGAQGVTSKYSGLKAMYYANLLDKEEALNMNNSILEDPKKYIKDYIESDTANRIFEETQKAEADRIKQEQDTIDSTLAGLQADTNKVYADALKTHGEALDEGLTRQPTPADKEAYLRDQLLSVRKEQADNEQAGKFNRKNMAEFSTQFDKELYTELKARENAILTALKPYFKEQEKSVSGTVDAARQASKAAQGKREKVASIIKEEFDDGTPGHYYQGIVRAFGEDGKSGIWNRRYINSDGGFDDAIDTYNTYTESTEKLANILERYMAAVDAKDPNAKDILSDADEFMHETGVQYSPSTPEQKAFADVQSELAYQEKELARLDTELHKPVIESAMWSRIGAMPGGLEKALKVAAGPDAAVIATLPTYYPEVYDFIVKEVSKYTDSLDLDANMDKVNDAIIAEVNRAKEAYDNMKSGTFKSEKKDGPVTEDVIVIKMDQTNEQVFTRDKPASSQHFANSDNLYPATHAEKVTEYKVTNQGWQTVYTNEGKQLSNPEFLMGHTIFIGKDGKPMNGFIKRGMGVVFTFTGEYRGKNENAEKEIRITDSEGNHIGYMDTASRLKKVIKTLSAELKTATKPERIRELEATINKYNELIPYYNKMRQDFNTEGDTKVGKVADKISNSDNSIDSGGVRFGSIITTKDKDGKSVPIDIDAAFALETLNKDGGVFLSVFANGEFLVYSPEANGYVTVDKAYKGIAIPEFAKNPQTLSGTGNMDGSVFALVPTNTFDQLGNRIYMSVKQYTRKVTNISMTSDGTYKGKTVPEQMLDVITNPDAFSEEFRMLAASVGVPFKKEFAIASPENSQALKSFYNTTNLLELFNRVIYMYDSNPDVQKSKYMDYSHHIGISVFNPKASEEKGLNRPVIRFDLSNDLSKRNTYVINLYDENGIFNPSFGSKKVKAEALMTADQRAAAGALGQAETTVDVKDEIVKRLRQKLQKVDIKLLSRTSAKQVYKALVFHQGRLVEQNYDSYLHYLADKQVIESTVHGVDFKATDPKTGKVETGRTYFDNQSFWFDMSPVKTDAQPAEVKPSSKTKTSRKVKPKAVKAKTGRKSKKAKQPMPTFPVHEAIQTSMSLVKKKKIKKVGEGANSHYLINGERYERLSHILKPPKDVDNAAVAAGRVVDTAIKTILSGGVINMDQFTPEAAESITKGVEDFQQYLLSNGQKIVGTDIILYAKVKGSDGITRNIAGETDIMTSDQRGNHFIYDFKSSNASFSTESYQNKDARSGESRYDNNRQQLSGYSALLAHMTGEEAAGVGIVPFTLKYTSDKKATVVEAVVPYEPIIFPDMGYISSIPVDSKTSEPDVNDVEGDVTEDDVEGMSFDQTDLSPEPTEFWMADLTHPIEMPSFIDVARFRDSSRSYYEQKGFEDYTTQMMLDVLYNHQFVEKKQSKPTYSELVQMTKDFLDKKIDSHKRVIKSINRTGGVMVKGVFMRQNSDQRASRVNQLERMMDLKKSIDESDDFIGYGKAGFMILSATDIVEVDVDIEELIIKGPEDQPYSVRFQDNYSVKINPKSTIGTRAKIFLSRIPELQRSIVKGELHFPGVSNMFGMKQYMSVDEVLDSLYIDFEGVAPERFMDKLDEMNQNNPIIRSVMQTLKDIEATSPDTSNQIRHQLSALLKQRRDMKFLKVDTDDHGDVDTAKVIDAARLGVKNNIIKQWENLFRSRFETLFKLDEKDGNLRSTNHTATPRKLTINYTEKGVGYDTHKFTLPSDFDESTHPTTWQTEWLYNELKSIAEGNTKQRVAFEFENGNLVINGTRLKIGQGMASQMLLLFQSDNLIVDKSMESLFEGKKEQGKYLKDSILAQIVANIDYFSRPSLKGVTSGDPGAPKDSGSYSPIYFKIMADQMNRVGIQLSEQASESWTVLQDLNNPLGSRTQRRKYNRYDPRAEDFNRFIVDKIGKRTIFPLLEPKAFHVGQQEHIDEDGGEFMETQKTINIETPFGHSLAGLDPFAKHSRSEWRSYINSTIRNAKGDLEYTYTDPNGLSTLITKLKDSGNGYLQQIGTTAMGRHNVFVQQLLNSKDALNAFTLHYVDAGKIDNYSVVEPDNLNSAKSQLLLWNNYYNNETQTAHRNKGGYITTHSDSSIMPIFNFDKQTVPIDFIETILPDGTRKYRVSMSELTRNGEVNTAYKHLLGIFTGELQRIYETFEIWDDINSKKADGTERTNEEKIEYAFKTYTMGSHFNFDKGVLSPGNGINLFMFGSTMYDGNNSGIYQSKSKTGLRKSFFDDAGNPNEAKLKTHFNNFVNTYLNELIDDAYGDLEKMGPGFFTITETKAGTATAEGTKTVKRSANPTLLDKAATGAMKSLFEKHARVVNLEENGGVPQSVTMRELPIEKKYQKDKLKKEGMTDEEAAVFIAEQEQVREQDIKASTYPELFMRYLVSDMAINHAIFYGSLFSIMADPAVMEAKGSYAKFKDVFEKRMKGPVSPGKVNYFADNEPVRVLPFEDIRNGDIKISIEGIKLYDHEKEFIAGFDKNIGTTNGKYPARIFDYMSFYYGQPKADRDQAWKVIKDRMEDKITDGGSYMSTREWLYRSYRKGDITKKEYFDTLDYYYTNDKGKQAIGSKILKYVYAGNNIVGVGDSFSNIYSYIKDSQMPLLPDMFKNTVLDALRKQVDEIEKIEYAGSNKEEPTPGIVLLPSSSFKTGFSSVAKVIDEDGQPTRDLLKTRVLQLNRGWLREQLQSPDEKDKRATITAQGNVLADLNAVASYRYGQRGDITFGRMQAGEADTIYDDDGNEIEIQETSTGISSNVLQNSVVGIVTEIAKRRLTDKMYELGLTRDERGMVIDSVGQFLSKMKSQAINQFGIGSVAASYLNVIEENGDEVLPIPVSFTTAGKRIQSVLLSELKDIFYKLTLPGGAFTQYSAAGVYTIDKSKFTADSQLKSYRVHLRKSKQYDSAEAAMKDFAPEEIHKEWDQYTKIVEYYDFSPAEAIVPWMFKDASGKLLDYDKYVNDDGTPKAEMFDKRLFEFSAFRVPNTGPNSSIRMTAVKFTRPGYGDGIATAPEVVAIIGADFDYDKLYSYMYHYKIAKDGKLEKIESVLHPSQDRQDFQSDDAQRQFAKNELMKTEEYRELRYRLKQAKAGNLSLEQDFNQMLQAIGQMDDGTKMGLKDLADLREQSDPKSIAESIRVMEDEFMSKDGFDRNYAQASIYEKQSMYGLENALIDRFNVTLGDFKTLKQMVTPTSSAWLQDQVERKMLPSIDEKGKKDTVSINEALNDNKYHSITSFNTFNNARLANASAAEVIARAANAQISQYQGQRWNLFINQMAFAEEYRRAYQLRFNDSKGRLKQEDEANRSNSSYPGTYNPYRLATKKKLIYEAPEDGRYRLDRVWVTNDAGEKVYVSTVIQSILQAALDHQKNPLIDKASITPNTLNAAVALARLGYVDEIVPLLKQDSVNEYVLATSNYYNIENKERATDALVRILGKYAAGYGYDAARIWNVYNGLPKDNRTFPILTQAVMDLIDADNKATLNTKDLLLGVSQRAGLVPKDEDYNLRQLEALRSYIVAETTGKQLFSVQNSTAAYTKGLKTSFAAMDMQDMMFKALFTYNNDNGKFSSSAPLIGGLHRIDYKWANQVGRPKEFRPTMMSFGQFYGLQPSKRMIDSLQGSVFTEFTPLFRQARSQAFLTSIGLNPNPSNISKIGVTEYERVFNKVNTNMVSFLFSNPALYAGLISNPDEYALFERYGIELITRPHKDIPYNEGYELFKSPVSLSKQLMELEDKVNPNTGNKYVLDYDVLEALTAIANTSYKTPSSVIYNNTFGYQENVNHRIAMSLAEMYYSPDPEIKAIAKKLILYAFLSGGITTPNSFVQFIPPAILIHMGFDTVIRGMMREFSNPQFAHQAVTSFMIQYYQHFPFELRAEVKPEDFKHVNGTHLQVDKDTGIPVLQINPLVKDKFANKYIFRLENRLYVKKNDEYLMRIDNLGMNKFHRNEYRYNTLNIPAESMYSHNIADNSRVLSEGLEVQGMITEVTDKGDEAKDMLRRLERPMFDKLMDRPTDLESLITDIELDQTNLTAASILGFLKPILRDMDIKLEFKDMASTIRGQYMNDTITMNPQHPKYKGLLTGNPADMNIHAFAETLAHEATHAATVKSIKDVLSGKEKDPDKIKAVKTLQNLMEKSQLVISKDPSLSKSHHAFVLLQKSIAEQSAKKKESPEKAAERQLIEFVAYVFTNERFQKDMNKVMFNKNETWWQSFIKAVLNLLGLNISDDEAQLQVDKIKKRLVAREDYITRTGEVDRRKTGLSDAIKELTPFSALHVAFREIIAITDDVKRQLASDVGAERIGKAVERVIKKEGKLYMMDLYEGVPNFDASWSEEMMDLYNKANLNRNIIC